MDNFVQLLLNLQFLLFLSGLHFSYPSFAYPSRHETRQRYLAEQMQTRASPSLAQYFKQTPPEQKSMSDVKQKRAKPVNVLCYPDHMEVVVNANLFDIGIPIDGNDLHLGAAEEGCRAVQSSADEFTLAAGLLDCGAERQVNEDFIIYTNILVYSPRRAPNEVFRMEEATIPVGCQFERKFSVSSDALQPTWVPYSASIVAEENFMFNLKIMTGDWLHKRGTRMYFLGSRINIEASVLTLHHTKMRVFINSCVATMSPDPNSLPRYEFIQDGCLIDSQLTDSHSHFLPRSSDDKLQFSIDAFRFHRQEGVEIFISCLLAAVPVSESEDTQLKSCSFINERWRSSEGHDLLCNRCQRYDGIDGPNPGAHTPVSKPYNTGFHKRANLSKGWEKETALVPLVVLPGKPKNLPVTLRVPGHSDPRRHPLSSSKWKTRVDTHRGTMNEDSDIPPILNTKGMKTFTKEEEDSMIATQELVSPGKEIRDEKLQKPAGQGYGKNLDKTDAKGFLAPRTPKPRSFKDSGSEKVFLNPAPETIKMKSLIAKKERLTTGLLKIPTPEPSNMDNLSSVESGGSRRGTLDILKDLSVEEKGDLGQGVVVVSTLEPRMVKNSSSESRIGLELGLGAVNVTVAPGISLLPGDLEAMPVNSLHKNRDPASVHRVEVSATTQGFETAAATPRNEGPLTLTVTPTDLALSTSKQSNQTEAVTMMSPDTVTKYDKIKKL